MKTYRRAGHLMVRAGMTAALLANADKVTLGPAGPNVVIAKSLGEPTITKDGVTIAMEIELENKLETWGRRWRRR